MSRAAIRSGRKPRVLFLSSQIPFRGSRAGGAKRLYFLAKALAAECDLHVVCLDAAGERPLWEGTQPEFAKFHFIPYDLSRNRGVLRLLKAEIDIHGDLADHAPALMEFLGEGGFDATLYAYPLALSVGHLIGEARLGRRVFMDDDLLFEVYRRRWQARPTGFKRMVFGLRFGQLMAYYRRRLEGAACFVSISEEERQVVRGRFPRLETSVISHGIPLSEHPLLPLSGNGPSFGFIGNFRHLPNLRVVEWILSDFLPLLASRFPEGRLILAGTGLSQPMAEALDANPRVDRIENVARLEDFYSRFRFFLNPVLTGRGLRTKLVEAAAFGRAMLSTPLGAEGLENLRIGRADTAGQFLDLAAALIEDPEEYVRQVAWNRKVCEEEFSIESQVARLLPILTGQPLLR